MIGRPSSNFCPNNVTDHPYLDIAALGRLPGAARNGHAQWPRCPNVVRRGDAELCWFVGAYVTPLKILIVGQ